MRLRLAPMIVCATAAAFLQGCVPNKTWKPGESAFYPAPDHTYRMITVEFGEQGNYKDHSQIDLALSEIRKTRCPLLVVYIHGWHNDARNADRFKSLLQELGESRHIVAAHRQVIGVYLAWRGESLEIPGVNVLTFWNRFDAGAKLGSGYDCFDAIAATVSEARKKTDARTILVGHSFGGLVLQQAIAHSISEAIRNGRSLAPADLTLLINPASDSEVTREMIEALKQNVRVPNSGSGKTPAIVSMTSEGDSATGIAFPISKYPTSLTKTFDRFEVQDKPRVSGRYFYTHTPGHNNYLLSHETTFIGSTSGSDRNAFEENLGKLIDPNNPQFKTSDDRGNNWKLWTFSPIGKTQTPYWVVAVDKKIIPNHTDIFPPEARAMMAAFYRLNHPLASSGPVMFIKTATAKQKPVLQAPAVRGQTVIPTTKPLRSAPVPAPPRH